MDPFLRKDANDNSMYLAQSKKHIMPGYAEELRNRSLLGRVNAKNRGKVTLAKVSILDEG